MLRRKKKFLKNTKQHILCSKRNFCKHCQSILHFKLSPCCECCILCFGRFPGLWILCTDVSERSVVWKWLMKMEQAHKIQTPGNHPKEKIQHCQSNWETNLSQPIRHWTHFKCLLSIEASSSPIALWKDGMKSVPGTRLVHYSLTEPASERGAQLGVYRTDNLPRPAYVAARAFQTHWQIGISASALSCGGCLLLWYNRKRRLGNVHKAVFGVCTTSIRTPSQNPFALSEYNMLAFSFFHCNNMKGGVHIFNNQSEGWGGNSAVYMALICHSNNGDMSILSTSASGQMCSPFRIGHCAKLPTVCQNMLMHF